MSRGLIILLSLLLNSCAVLRPSEPPLLSPASLQQNMQLNQTLVSHFDGQRHQLLVAVKINAEQLLMLGFSAEGQRLFTLNYDGSTLQQQSLPALQNMLDAERILRLFQLAYWPQSVLQLAYGNDFQIIDQPMQRELMHNERKIITIDYSIESRWKGSVSISHHQQPLKLKITTTDFTPL